MNEPEGDVDGINALGWVFEGILQYFPDHFSNGIIGEVMLPKALSLFRSATGWCEPPRWWF